MMGTMPLFSPNTGMKMKLWSLKYAPYTAVATVENVSNIWFIPNTSSEPTHCIRIDGKPIW